MRRLDVAVYDGPLSTTLLRDRGGGRQLIRDLRFSTALPGGFADASFVVLPPASAVWPISQGQKVVIQMGRQVIWWGWVEDVQRRVRGRTELLEVQCLGPYQEAQQRLIASVNYTSDQIGSAAIRAELAANCPNISSDYSQIDTTSVVIGPLVKSYWGVAELIRLVCETGDDSNRQMLFAIWEPPRQEEATEVLRSRNVALNPDFDGPDWYGWEVGSVSNGDYEIINTTSVSPNRSGKAYSTSAGSAGNLTLDNAYVAAVASAGYRFEYSYYFPALIHGSFKCRVSVGWWTSLNTLISYDYGSWHASTGSAGWVSTYADFTAPVNAAFMKAFLIAEWPAGTSYYVGWDDCYLSRLTTSEERATKPRARLWARDLTGYDYHLRTAMVERPVEFNETTRELSNYVVASYASSSYTAAAEDATSEAAYRRRDALVAAGSDAGSALAASKRDTYLETFGYPLTDIGPFEVAQRGAITTLHGAPATLPLVRAGDRLRLADGPYAGQVILLTGTEWRDGVLRCTPEGDYSLPQLLG